MFHVLFSIAVLTILQCEGHDTHPIEKTIFKELKGLQVEVKLQSLSRRPTPEEIGLDCEIFPLDVVHNYTYCVGPILSKISGSSLSEIPSGNWYQMISVESAGAYWYLEVPNILTKFFPFPLKAYTTLPKKANLILAKNNYISFSREERGNCSRDNCWNLDTMRIAKHIDDLKETFYSVIESFDKDWRNSTILVEGIPETLFKNQDLVLLEASNFLFDRFRTAFTGKFLDIIPFYGFQNIFFANDVYLKTGKLITEKNKYTEKIEISVTGMMTVKHYANVPWPIDKTHFDFTRQKGISKNPGFMKILKNFHQNVFFGFPNDNDENQSSVDHVTEIFSSKQIREPKMLNNKLMINENFYVGEMIKSLKLIRPNIILTGLRYEHMFNFIEEFYGKKGIPAVLSENDRYSSYSSYRTYESENLYYPINRKGFYYIKDDGNVDNDICTGIEDCEETNDIVSIDAVVLTEVKTEILFPNSCSSEYNITLTDVKDEFHLENSKRIGTFFFGNLNFTVNWKDKGLDTFDLQYKLYSAKFQHLKRGIPGMDYIINITRLGESYMDINYWSDPNFSSFEMKSLNYTAYIIINFEFKSLVSTVHLHNLDRSYRLSINSYEKLVIISYNTFFKSLKQHKIIATALDVLYYILDDVNDVLNTVNAKCGEDPPNALIPIKEKLQAFLTVDYVLDIKRFLVSLAKIFLKNNYEATSDAIKIPYSAFSNPDYINVLGMLNMLIWGL